MAFVFLRSSDFNGSYCCFFSSGGTSGEGDTKKARFCMCHDCRALLLSTSIRLVYVYPSLAPFEAFAGTSRTLAVERRPVATIRRARLLISMRPARPAAIFARSGVARDGGAKGARRNGTAGNRAEGGSGEQKTTACDGGFEYRDVGSKTDPTSCSHGLWCAQLPCGRRARFCNGLPPRGYTRVDALRTTATAESPSRTISIPGPGQSC